MHLSTPYAAVALPSTFQTAWRHPFYRQLWSGVCNGEWPAEDDVQAWSSLLEALPPLSRDGLAGLKPELPVGDAICTVSHSSGTTSNPVYRYRSTREHQLIAALSTPSPIGAPRLRPLGLSLYAPYHGQSDGAAGAAGAHVFTASIWEDHLVVAAMNALERTYDIPGFEPRITFVQGSVRFVRVLTQALVDRGTSRSQLAVRALGVFGGYLATEVRRHLEDYWAVKVVHRYSLSEAFGGATACPACGHLHFDAHLLPTLLEGEFVSHADSRLGELTITELFPYSLCHPLVKYRTGDIVEVLDDASACSHAHVGGLRHVGRAALSVCSRSGNGPRQVLLGSTELREALYCPEVGKSDELPQLSVLSDRSRLGVPIASASIDSSGRRLNVSFRPAADIEPGRARQVVTDRLLSASRSLLAAVSSGSVHLHVDADSAESGLLVK